MSWGLEKTYDDNDVRYISFYVCRGLDTIILEVRILKGYVGRLLAIITTHNNTLSAYYLLAFWGYIAFIAVKSSDVY